ncbi:hypothetical protein GCM10009854_48720 [Saccharopolyspora halophila]|uniref:Uncharacterized protein n=1 Tax=Saccharopolyspora halophila TaxID=405551 RepID=A0ABN3GWX7_9PSEU
MFVVVVVVGGVTVPVVDVVDVVAVRHRDVPAALTVGVLVAVVGGVISWLALVVVVVVSAVQVTVVGVIDMIAVRDGDVPAALTMGVLVPSVLLVCRGHRNPSIRKWASRAAPLSVQRIASYA